MVFTPLECVGGIGFLGYLGGTEECLKSVLCPLQPVVDAVRWVLGAEVTSSGGARVASSEVTQWCHGSSPPLVVALSTSVGGDGSFCGAVLELGVILTLSFSSVCGRV